MSRIRLMRDPIYAPCCFILARAPFDARDEANTILVQSDWDWPSIASDFGEPKFLEMGVEGIAPAGDWLIEHVGSEADDPGYFLED